MDFDQSAYTLEFFKFTPDQISAERDHLIKSLIGRAVESTIAKIKTPITSGLLTKEKTAVIDLMMANCQPKLDELREQDKRTFNVPPHVLLIKDFEMEQQVTEEEEHSKAAELEKLKLLYRQNMAMIAELKAEQERFQKIETFIQKELEMHHRIYDACSKSELKNLHVFASNLADIADKEVEMTPCETSISN